MNRNQQPTLSNAITNEKTKSSYKPIYQKPKTSLFLEKATNIQSGATVILESQGSGYLSS